MNLELENDIALLRLAAGKGNAINDAFLADTARLVDEALGRRARALVITGHERFFSGGLDLRLVSTLDRAALGAFLGRVEALMLKLFTLDLPVVAAVNGHAVAGGCVLALQADRRLMSGGKIGLIETQLGMGLPPFVIETLRPQVPPSSLFPIALEGRSFDPAGALAMGLVDEVVAPDALVARALELARALASIPGPAFAQVKRGLRAPALDALTRVQSAGSAGWLDAYYSPECQAHVRQALARLGG